MTKMGFKSARKKMAHRLYEEPTTRPKRKKAAKRRKSTTKKSALARKLEELNALTNKMFRNAESLAKKAKESTDSKMKRAYQAGENQALFMARSAQRKAAELLKK
jgi:hypothetical protein